jgi:hypothetical protein
MNHGERHLSASRQGSHTVPVTSSDSDLRHQRLRDHAIPNRRTSHPWASDQKPRFQNPRFPAGPFHCAAARTRLNWSCYTCLFLFQKWIAPTALMNKNTVLIIAHALMFSLCARVNTNKTNSCSAENV